MVDPFASWSSLCLTVCRSSAVTHLDDLLHARGCGGLSHWDDGVFSPGQSGPICGRVSVLCANWLCTRDVRGQREGDPMCPLPPTKCRFVPASASTYSCWSRCASWGRTGLVAGHAGPEQRWGREARSGGRAADGSNGAVEQSKGEEHPGSKKSETCSARAIEPCK